MTPINVSAIEFADFGNDDQTSKAIMREDMNYLADISLNVRAVLGHFDTTVGEVSRLKEGDVLEVSRIAGHTVDVFVANQKVAVGEIIVMDNQFGLSISQVLDEKGEFLKNLNRSGEFE